MSDVDLLRRASAKVRETAEAATKGPWQSMPMGSEGSTVFNDGTTWRTSRRICRTPEFADGDHIALFDPTVALAVADWLTVIADRAESISSGAPRTVAATAAARIYGGGNALLVAKAILREPAPVDGFSSGAGGPL